MIRDRYVKKKIVGGNIGGNLFDVVKKLFSVASKVVAAKLPDVAHSFAIGAAKTAGERLATNLIRPEAEKVKQPEDDSRAILSNLIAGSGCKRGRGLARIK